MSEKPSIVACIPAYNEENAIAKVLVKTAKYVDSVIVCDDGSRDLTAEIARKLGVEVIQHERNFGKGAALKTLFEKARKLDPDVVVTLDSDGQHNPDEIPKLVEPILNGEADIVNGSRFLGNAAMPKHRIAGNKTLNLLTNLRLNQKLTDTQCGFRAYSKKALKLIDVTEMGIGVDSQILMGASEKGLKIVEVPIGASYKNAKSTYNPLSHLMMVIDSVVGRIVEENPVLYLGLPGFISMVAGLLAGLRVVSIFLANRAIATGTALISIGLIVVGFLLLISAIIVKTVNSVAGKVKR